MTFRSLVWLRDDLRLADNPALARAFACSDDFAVLFVHEHTPSLRPIGGAASWWLNESLALLGHRLEAAGVTLVIEAGDPRHIVPAAARRLGVSSTFWNRRYERAAREIDTAIKADLKGCGITATSFAGNVLTEPWTIGTASGDPFQVYTPFAKAVRRAPPAFPLPDPLAGKFEPPVRGSAGFSGQPAWARKLHAHWMVGETGAQQTLLRFFEQALPDYADERDRPDRPGTSTLSPHLRFGEISARQIWHAAVALAAEDPARQAAVEKFLSELIWRDFNYHQLYHRPDIARTPMRATLAGLSWRDDTQAFSAWKLGCTGIPIVDAGMRQLWETGWMHNRVRMLVASFLTKNLLMDWRKGEEWFWDTLVDADVASNPGNWQWVAGCGMDAAPYFRIFNPVLQGERFDPSGAYVRQWIPELGRMPHSWIHRPFEAPETVLSGAGVVLGKTYPSPIVDLAASHRRAREMFASKKL